MTRSVSLWMTCIAVAAFTPVKAGEWDLTAKKEDFHIFLLMGQSNMAGGFKESHLYDDVGNYDPVTNPVPRVLLQRGREWIPAAHPLTKHVKRSFSLPLPFAEKYLEEIGDPEVKVGLIIRAFGGKAIDHFTEGGRYHPSSQALGAAKQQGTFKGIIWHQGEADTLGVLRFTAYERKLHGLVADIRNCLHQPDLSFVTGQITHHGSNEDPGNNYWSESIGVIARVLANVGDNMNRAAHVRSSGAATCTEHIRKLVDDNGTPSGATMRMPEDAVHFNRSGYTTMAHRYVNAILDRPSFKNDPVRIIVVPGRPFATSLIQEVSDLSKDKLTFSVGGNPDWLTLSPDGTISGAAPAPGTNACAVTVTDRSGAVDTTTLHLIGRPAGPPVFEEDAFTRPPAIAGQAYRNRVRYVYERAWSSELHEPNKDPLTYSKVNGPDWLTVTPDGVFLGTPGVGDTGTNAFTVKVADTDGSDTARYGLTVLDEETVWREDFNYYPDIRYQEVGDVLEFHAATPKDIWFIPRGSFPVNERKAYHDLHTSLSGQMYKFHAGALGAYAIVLDGRRFSGRPGRYSFRFNLFGVKPEDAHFIVTLYDIHAGSAPDAGFSVALTSRQLRGVPAEVHARGDGSVSRIAEMDFRSRDGSGFKDLDFTYDGDGDVLVVLSASRDSKDRGGGSAFDDLSIRRVSRPAP